ncbi:tetratricopeptide repeat protein [Pannus brasiliensis CCIBt3594]|uniref:Tetratricopeptide repeat protein n=1 Tax=Pannus brasiliensis CCIBt3594 TaxID=1427578 RepID=A0AAW9QZS5_9CHRO
MSKLSLCMIVKNEAATLAKCLDSVKGVVDEMVVMDTGSTDGTIALAESYGAKVPVFQWNGNFSDARNAALEHVTGDWILVLDADEELNPSIVPAIREAMAGEENLVITFLRREVGAVQSPYSLVSRLFRKHPKVYFTRPYHAIIDDSVAELLAVEACWKVVEIPSIGIEHYGYTSEKIQGLGKFDRAREAMEKFFQSHPSDPYVCSKLGALYLKIGREKEGLKLLKQGLKNNNRNPHILYELHFHLANAYSRHGEIDRALNHYQKALDQPIMETLKIGTYNNFGAVLQSLGRWEEARKAFASTIVIDPNFSIGYYNLGMVLKQLQRFPEAIQAYQKAIQLAPDYAEAYQNLGVTFLSFGNYQDAVNSLQTAARLWEERGNSIEAEKLREYLRSIGVG